MKTLVEKFQNYDKLSKEARSYNVQNGGIIENDTNDINARWWEARRDLVDFIINNIIFPEERVQFYSTRKNDTYIQNKLIEIGRTVLKMNRLIEKEEAK